MKRIVSALLALGLCQSVHAAGECFVSGVTDQYTYFVAVDATDFTTRETGLSGFTVYRSRDGGAASAYTTPTINETDTTNMPGVYELLLDEDTTLAAGNDYEEMVLHITVTGMAPVSKSLCIVRPKATAGETLTVSSGVATANTTLIEGADATDTIDARVAAYDAVVPADLPTNFADLSITATTGRVDVAAIGGTAQTANDNGADINAILVDTGTTLDTYLTDIQGATFSSATDSLEAIRDRGDAAWTTGAGTGLTSIAVGTAQSGTASTIVLAAGEAFGDDILNGNSVCVNGGTGDGQCRTIIDYTGATDTASITPNWTTNPSSDSTYEVYAGSANVVSISLTAQTANDNGADINDILVDTGTTLDDLVDDLESRLGVPSNFGSGTSTIAANLEDIADNGTASYDRTTDSLQVIRDRGDAAWTTGAGSGLTPLAGGTAQGGTATTIQLATGETFADDILIGSQVKITGGTGAGQHAVITDYTGATDTATVHTQYASNQWLTNPSSDSVYEIVPGTVNVQVWNGSGVTTDVETAASIRAEIDSNSTQLAKIGTITNLGSGTTIAANLVDIEAETDDIGAAGAGLSAVPWNASWDAEVQSEVNDGLVAYAVTATTDLPTNFADLSITATTGRVDVAAIAGTAQTANDVGADVDAILVDTAVIGAAGAGLTEAGGTGDHLTAITWNAAWDAEVQSEANDALVANNLDHVGQQVLFVGNCDSGTTTTCVDAALTEADDHWKGVGILFLGGGANQESSCVYDFVAATDTLTFRARTAAVSTDDYILFVSPLCEGVVSP